MTGHPRIGPPPVAPLEEEPNLLARPSVWVIAVGLVCLAAAEFVLPWASIPDEVVVDGRNEPDGLITLFLGLLILFFALSHSAASSDTRTVQIASGLLGLAVLAIAVDAFQLTSAVVHDYVREEIGATLEVGMTAEGVGSLLVAVGGVATSVSIVKQRTALRSEGEAARPATMGQWLTSGWVAPELSSVSSDMTVLLTVGAAGVVLGWVTAVWLAGDSAARLTGLGLLGVLLGPAVTVSLWRRVTRRRP
jgi:hypothetical protein